MLRPWREWRPVDHATIAFGQGVSVTPIQLAAALGALANGGVLAAARAWSRRAARPAAPGSRAAPRAHGACVRPRDRGAACCACSRAWSARAAPARAAALPGVRVAGKTGTAQKFDTREGRYSQQRFRAWFVGVAPADDPRVVIVTGLDEPKRPYHTGGASAAPLFAPVARAQLAQQGIHVDERADADRAAPPVPDDERRRRAAAGVGRAARARRSSARRRRAAGPRRRRRRRRRSPAPRARRARAPVELASFRGRVLLPDFSGLERRAR